MSRKTLALLVVVLGMSCAVPLAAATLDEALQQMNAKAESIKDVQVLAKVVRYDSVFEQTSVSFLRLYFQRPHLAHIDTIEKQGGADVVVTQYILGKDFLLRIWPRTHTGERTWMDPTDIDKKAAESNDPLSLFTRKPDDIKKDFNIEMIPLPAGTPPASVALRITAARPDVKFEFKSVEMVVDSSTWLPRSIKALMDDDWSDYQFVEVKLNPNLTPDVFQPPPGIDIKDVKQ